MRMDVGVLCISHVRMVFATYVSGIFSIAWNVYCMQFFQNTAKYILKSSK